MKKHLIYQTACLLAAIFLTVSFSSATIWAAEAGAAVEADIDAAPDVQSETESTANTETAPAAKGETESAAKTETAPSAEGETESADSTIPVLYFDIDESRGTIEEMNTSEDHSANCYGSVDIEVPEGYQSEYGGSDFAALKDLELDYIRGRGNSTWSADKKAYKVKFAKKQNLFGMGANKHWVLIANRFDNTQLHNRITYWLASQMGMEFTPQCVPVEVVMNGRYFGLYLLCEQIRVDDNRIEIDELTADDTEEPEITGGYFLSVEPYEKDPEAGKFTTKEGVNFYINSPGYEEEDDEGTAAHKAYIRQYVQDTENAIFGDGFKDENGKSYREFLDFSSAVDYWWVQEFTTNHDAYKTPSTYLYKKRNGKLYWGPLWDFDSEAWGNLQYNPEQYEISSFYITSMDSAWMSRLMLDEAFTDALVQRWPAVRELLNDLIKEGGVLDQYYEEMKTAQGRDNELYGYYDPAGPIKDDPDRTYAGEIEQLRAWTRARMNWIDNNLALLKNITCSITFMADGQETPVAQIKLLKGYPLSDLPDAPEKEGFIWIRWQTADGTDADDIFSFEEDMTFYAYYVPEEEAVLAEDIFFNQKEVWIELKEGAYAPQYTIVPEDTQENHPKWSSSDPSAASVNEKGQVQLHAAGMVTITAALKNGKTNSYQLHITDSETPEYVKLESISFEKDTLSMQVGEYAQNEMRLLPEGLMQEAPILLFSSDNEEVVTVDNNGVLHAVREGTAVITVEDFDSGKTASFTVNAASKPEEKDAEEKGTEDKSAEEKGTENEGAEEIAYSFSKGENGTWTTGSSGTFELTVHRSIEDDTTFSRFKEIAADGTVIDAKYYDVSPGSLDASLKAAYLNTLSAGSHTLTVYFEDGSAETKLTVTEAPADDKSKDKDAGDSSKKNDKTNGSGKSSSSGSSRSSSKSGSVPRTGDDTNAIVWLIMLLAAASILGVLTVLIRRRSGSSHQNTV